MKKIIDELIKLSKIALENDDVPVSCIITLDDKIIAKSYNKKEKKHDPTNHAEINCIRQACKKLKTSNLSDCKLYSLLYPCNMCKEVIKESRLKNVYYILANDKKIVDNVKYKQMFIDEDKSEEIKANLVNFFKNKR